MVYDHPMSFSKYRFVQKNQELWYRVYRLERSGLTTRQIAKLVKRSNIKIERTVNHPLYQEFKAARDSRRVALLDKALTEDDIAMQKRLQELVPLAIQTYEYALEQAPENIRAALVAADSVLDRDTRFSKQSTSVVEHRIQQSEIDRARELARQLRPTAIQALPAVESDRTIAGEIVEEACSKDTLEATIALKSEQKT